METFVAQVAHVKIVPPLLREHHFQGRRPPVGVRSGVSLPSVCPKHSFKQSKCCQYTTEPRPAQTTRRTSDPTEALAKP